MFEAVLKKLPIEFKSFVELDIIHRVADHLFVEHQMACMSADWDGALNAMEVLYELRMQSIQDAEDLLLPLYQSVIDEIPQGGAIKFFVRENKLIRKNLDSFVHNISNIVLYNSGNDINLVELFESYHSFKDLLDHHDARERAFLYKLLDGKSDIGSRESALREVNIRYAKMLDKIGVPV